MAVLLDTGFVYAGINRTERRHEAATRIAREIRGPMLLPTPVIVEVAAMAERMDVHLILTLDQRHFCMFRPRHRIAFELLP